MLKTIERLILKYLIQMVYLLSQLLPVRHQITFATHRTTELVDNFKFIDEELTRQGKDYRRVYLLKKIGTGVKGRIGYVFHLMKATFYLATSKYFIIDDFYFPVYVIRPRKGTEIVQVWHACGAFKKFGYSVLDKEYGADNRYIKHIPIHRNYHHVLVSAKEVIPHYAQAFNMTPDNIRPIGIPRTDLFFDSKRQERSIQRVYEVFPQLQGKKLVLYAPTFRGATQADVRMNIPFDLDEVVKTLKDDEILGLKMHPFVQDLPDLRRYDQVIDLSSYPEVNDLLLITTLLITDYSSLVFEYALLERPILFFAHDRETYVKERDFYYKYTSFIPGTCITTTEELVQALTERSDDLEKVRAFKAKFFDEFDGKATERVVTSIFKA